MKVHQILLKHTRYYVSRACNVPGTKHKVQNVISEFDTYLPRFVDKSLAKTTFIETEELKDRIKKASEYYTVGRRPLHGEFMLLAYQGLTGDELVNDELLHQLRVVVAAMEILISSGSFWDDISDDAKIRCGKPCWHLLHRNGSALAILDTLFLKGFTEEMIRQHFNGEMRDNIIMILNRICFITAMGEYIDVTRLKHKHYERFTMENLDTCYKHKSSYYAMKAPILLALALCNKLNKQSNSVVDNMCNEIGILMHIHNDVVDYFNSIDSVKGKSGTDIQESKCSWVAVAVLQKCNPEQRRVFVENYGSKEPERYNSILQLYKEIDVPKLYQQEEQARYETFLNKLNRLPENTTPSAEFFKSFYNSIRHYAKDVTFLMSYKHE